MLYQEMTFEQERPCFDPERPRFDQVATNYHWEWTHSDQELSRNDWEKGKLDRESANSDWVRENLEWGLRRSDWERQNSQSKLTRDDSRFPSSRSSLNDSDSSFQFSARKRLVPKPADRSAGTPARQDEEGAPTYRVCDPRSRAGTLPYKYSLSYLKDDAEGPSQTVFGVPPSHFRIGGSASGLTLLLEGELECMRPVGDRRDGMHPAIWKRGASDQRRAGTEIRSLER